MAAMLKCVLVLFVFLYIDSCKSDNLVLGTITNAQVAFVENIKLDAIPFKVRTKNVFYGGNQVIKGISATDLNNKNSKATVTAGGVGSTFTNIKLKGERGDELNYVVQIFV